MVRKKAEEMISGCDLADGGLEMGGNEVKADEKG